MQGVYARYLGGASAGEPGSVADCPASITLLAEKSRDLLQHDGSTGGPRHAKAHNLGGLLGLTLTKRQLLDRVSSVD
jgi:hypothetical protein